MISSVRLPGSSSTCATQVIKGLNKIFLEAVVQYVLLESNPDVLPFSLVGRTSGFDDEKNPIQFALGKIFGILLL